MKIDKHTLEKCGYTRFSCTSHLQTTIEVARSIGEILALPGVPPVQTLTPSQTEEKEASSYSGNYGMGEFPLHTDMAHWHVPPPYLLLRCIQPVENVHTSVISITNIVSAEKQETFKRSLFRPRRRLDGRLSVLRLYDRGVFRWDRLFIQPINNRGVELEARIAARIRNEDAAKLYCESCTDCILIDNWNAIHGRSPVPEFASNRIMERVFLSNINE